MAAPLSLELESLLNPQPRFFDPEDDPDEATTAKVIEKFDEVEIEDNDDPIILKNLKKRSATYLSDTDKRYQGKATSRKALREELGEPSFSEDSDNEISEGERNSELESSDEEQGDDFDEPEEESGEEEDEEDDESQSAEEDTEDEAADDNEMKEDGIQTFSKAKVSSDVAKGQGIKNQIAIWDQLLEGRIKIQKALLSANQLPQLSTFELFKEKGGSELVSQLFNSYKALKDLMRSLAQLQDELLFQFPETRYLIDGKKQKADSGDEEIPSDDDDVEKESEALKKKGAPKRKLKVNEYPDYMAKRFADFKSYRNSTLQKWHDKTKLSGKIGKTLGGDRSIPLQIEQIIMDKERLLRRTQTKRSLYTILGKSEPENVPVPESVPNEEMDIQVESKSNAQVKDLDEEIFDDDDFYHQLLRELIERRTSSVDPNDQVAMGRQWLAIQKLRSKIKRKVDTKASKGRKVRYHIHNKLVSFMAPIGHSTMNDEARTELYQSLFGKLKHQELEKSV